MTEAVSLSEPALLARREPPLPEPLPALVREPGSHVVPLGGGGADVQLWGPLRTAWSLHLSRALAQRRASLKRGYARRLEGSVWIARLEVALGPGGEPEATDFRALASKPVDGAGLPEPPVLHAELEPSDALGGALVAEVHAWEALGLLAAVLGRAAGCGLVAEEIELETEGECAFHRLLLRTPEAQAPTAGHRRSLARSLGDLL